jgi:hypothetical protein
LAQRSLNDPPIPDPKDPSKLDDAMFKGKAMTYYGRWTYKYEIAAAKGAAAARDSLAAIEHRPGRIELDPDGQRKQQRGENHEVSRRDE